MININNLSVSFKGKDILKNINIDIADGKTVVILGKNGSGKSVLLKTIAGLITEYTGDIKINDVDARKLYSDKYLKNNIDDFSISYVFQKGGLFDSMNVFENVAFPLRRRKKPEDIIQKTVIESLARVGLAGSEAKLPSELSGGMQKRAGLARAICVNPDIILYDDPTAGLDPILSDSISDVIIDIKKSFNSTSMVVTHDLSVAKKTADFIVLLYNGEIVYSANNDEFFISGNPYAVQFIEGNLDGPIDLM